MNRRRCIALSPHWVYGKTMNNAGTTTSQTVTLRTSIFTISTIGNDTVLTGTRGAQYFLRKFLGEDKGLRQVISYKSGQPLRIAGNEIRVRHIGDIIEQA